MFDDISYDILLKRMLDRVPDSMDKREGSVIFDALAPAAMELYYYYLTLEQVVRDCYGDTASRTYLCKRALERGLTPKPATYAVLQGEFNMDIPLGSRFSCDTLNYVATEQLGEGVYRMECETIGTVGNGTFGTLIPIDYIGGLTFAQLTSLLIPAEDEEDTETFRARYLASFDAQAFGGNRADYIEKVTALSGVGSVKVYPVWDGGGTVKLVILDSAGSCPSGELLDQVQTAIDPTQNNGEGLGLAPIGHVVTVEGAQEVVLTVSAKFTFVDGYDFDSAQEAISEAIADYFAELRQTWMAGTIVVRISQIETRLLALPALLDIENTAINGATQNLQLEDTQVPIMGGVSADQS